MDLTTFDMASFTLGLLVGAVSVLVLVIKATVNKAKKPAARSGPVQKFPKGYNPNYREYPPYPPYPTYQKNRRR